MGLTLEGSTVVLEKTPESPLDSKINQSILKEINPEYSLEGLRVGGERGKKRRDGGMASQIQWT